MSQRICGLSDIAEQYEGILCDVWGVLHNGREVYQGAANALANFRAKGGHVVMITNSPRPHHGVVEQLTDMGVACDVYDAVVTSGDATRVLIAETKGPAWFLGPDRDLPLLSGLNVELTGPEDCSAVICTGMFDDEFEKPEDYRGQLEELATRGVPFICANPDLVVHRGDRLIYCAGSLAKLYSELGGQTRVAGKPHKPIYDLAMAKLNEVSGKSVPQNKVIAVGDGMPTDVAGAQNNGFDLLYISAGIHFGEYGAADNPDEAALAAFLEKNDATPKVWMPRMVWESAV